MLWGTHFTNLNVITNPFVREALNVVKREDFVPVEKRYLADQDHPIEIGFGQTNSQPYTIAFMLELFDPQPGQKILDIGSGSGWTSALLACIVSNLPSLRGVGATKPASTDASQGGQSSNRYLGLSHGIHNSPQPSLILREGERAEDRHASAAPVRDDIRGGKVYAVERIPELVTFGKENADKYSFTKSGILQFIHSDGTLGLPEHAPYDRILVSATFKSFPEKLVDQLSEDGILVVPLEKPESGIMKAVKHSGKVEKEFHPGFVFVPMIRDNE